MVNEQLAMYDVPPEPPKMPRCFYRSWVHYLLGIPSPSRHFNLSFNPTPEAKEYFKSYKEYQDKLMLWKIENRTCTREEWASWYKRKRHEIRAAQSMEDAVRSIQKSAHICAMKLKIRIRKAVQDGQQG